nr:MAG TPA: hypothetical protein [Bacteriophage sp.]DAF36383.1 MAG TPA: hypothetical protein [Bacteriophage sp.]DAP33012.1 MAG TPA: hypothetical protein [Caudoviricetes sp.]
MLIKYISYGLYNKKQILERAKTIIRYIGR